MKGYGGSMREYLAMKDSEEEQASTASIPTSSASASASASASVDEKKVDKKKLINIKREAKRIMDEKIPKLAKTKGEIEEEVAGKSEAGAGWKELEELTEKANACQREIDDLEERWMEIEEELSQGGL